MVSNPTLLVPVDASDPGEPAVDLVELLEPLRVVVLGYYPVPDQTAPDQVRAEHEAAARDAMAPTVRAFAERGDVESVLVFTRDLSTSVDRVANEHDCDAVLLTGAVESIDRLVVSLKDEQNMFRVLEVVELLLAAAPGDAVRGADADSEASDPRVTLFHADSVERGSARSELYLRGATDWLVEHGLDRERIDWREPTADTQETDLIDLAADHDFVVTGEFEPGLRERVLGDLPTRVRDETGRPVLVVRKQR